MSVYAFLLTALCVAAYTGQNFFNKMYSVNYKGPSDAATPVFSIIYGLFTGLVTLAACGFRFAPSVSTVWLGLLCGGILFAFNLSIINASRTGPYAFQNIMMLFGNILVPLAVAFALWGEKPTPLQLGGIAVMLIAFVVFNMKGFRFDNVKKGYYLWVILLFLTNGFYGAVMDTQQKLNGAMQREEMIAVTFFTSAAISAVYLLLILRKKPAEVFDMGKKNYAFVLGSSACAALAINILMLTLSLSPAAVVFTATNGGVLVGTAILGFAVLHEKLEKHMIVAIALVVAGLAIFSL